MRGPRQGFLKNRGFTLIEALITMGIIASLALLMASMRDQFLREKRFLSEKITSLETQRFLNSLATDPATCSCQLDSNLNTALADRLKVNTTATPPPDIDLGVFRSGCDFTSTTNIVVEEGKKIGPPTQALNVTKVQITQIRSTGTADQYTAWLTVNMSNDQGHTFHTRTPLRFNVDSTTPPATRRISGCQGFTAAAPSAGGPTGCPPGFSEYRWDDGYISCYEPNSRSAPDFWSASQTCRDIYHDGWGNGYTCSRWLMETLCNDGLLGSSGNEFIGHLELVMPWDPPGQVVGPVIYSRSSCNYVGVAYFSSTINYRCCI
ncbi:MAG: prepilin-type N-terminal cleavage/methylation domain-containing protein [Calothrix sp. SM1_5_4]|nr:prepilin-type N-terminal cleavage/methylation domain-containing protein [Calothrix sp. SM1_5_4]